jgi:flagellar biogenesis protein FliO
LRDDSHHRRVGDTLFGEGQSGLKVVLFVIVVLGLLALAFWLLRRFGGGRLGGGATRGRQPRLAVIDQATVDSRRRLVLIRPRPHLVQQAQHAIVHE